MSYEVCFIFVWVGPLVPPPDLCYLSLSFSIPFCLFLLFFICSLSLSLSLSPVSLSLSLFFAQKSAAASTAPIDLTFCIYSNQASNWPHGIFRCVNKGTRHQQPEGKDMFLKCEIICLFVFFRDVWRLFTEASSFSLSSCFFFRSHQIVEDVLHCFSVCLYCQDKSWARALFEIWIEHLFTAA